ncbi:MAG: phenylalanine--tRNA ligase subunit beta [Deltaproteobacteria bacterium]|nr:MAG: phenylalanine--tRNA ligase subunit beta [Deltaproteobacteria bacterium]
MDRLCRSRGGGNAPSRSTCGSWSSSDARAWEPIAMKVLWSWLLELCDLDRQPTAEEGARALTRGGLEIEGLTDLGAAFRGVVVAEVVGKERHPQSEKLTLVDVITESGGAATRVVCGAGNVPAPGRKVLWAQVGATLPGPDGTTITLGAKPVKGVVSPGMLCAEDELGLGDDHDGIIVLDDDDRTPLGAPAQRALGLDDWLLEVNAPANRGDVLGHLGVARELVAMLRGKLVLPSVDLSELGAGGDAPALELAIADATGCPRYTARVIDGLRIAPSPRRIAQRLRNVGMRPISNLVDATNYVMFELGQPLHAFDADTLTSGVLGISGATDGERFVTLDGAERTLVPDDLMIRDGMRGIALAGVMGGLDTEVTERTTRVLLEAASFLALSVRRTARRLGLHSEASHRFERGVDPELAALASARAARLLCLFGGGRVLGELIDAYPGRRRPARIAVRLPRVRLLTGVALDVDTCRDALDRLGFEVGGGPDTLAVTPPSARGDVAREVDVIEEILRVVGYEQVPSTVPALRQVPGVRAGNPGDAARRALAAAGVSEAITYGFQSAARCLALGLPGTDRRTQPIALRNPMTTDQAVMRTSLVPNLLAAVARNASFGRSDVALFEVGSVFLRRGAGITERPMHELADEPVWATGVLAGRRPAQIGLGTPWDAFDAKALALVAIRAVAGEIALRVRATRSVPYLHPGVAGEIAHDGDTIGWFGEIHPEVRKRLGVEAAVFAFDLELSRLPLAGPPQMQPIPRFPGSARDVSLLLAEDIPAARVREVVEQAAEPLVQRVRLLEDYRDAKLGEGRKSMLWSIEYRSPERTLTDAEVDKAHETIVGRLVENLPAQRR